MNAWESHIPRATIAQAASDSQPANYILHRLAIGFSPRKAPIMPRETQNPVAALVGRHVLANVSTLVEHLHRRPASLTGSPHTVKDLDQVLTRKDLVAPLRDFVNAMPRAILLMEMEAIRLHPNRGQRCADLRRQLLAALDDQEGAMERFVEAHHIAPDETPTCEWWAVSDELASLLHARREAVASLFGLNIWGRIGAGIALDKDPVLARIAADHFAAGKDPQ